MVVKNTCVNCEFPQIHQPRVAFWKQSLTSRLVHTLENVNSSFTPTRSESIPPFQETVVDPFSHQGVTWHQKNLKKDVWKDKRNLPRKKNMSEQIQKKKRKTGYPWLKKNQGIPFPLKSWKIEKLTASKVVTCYEGGADMLLRRCGHLPTA